MNPTSQAILVTDGKLVCNEVEVEIKRPLSEVYQWVVYTPLEIQLPGTDKIPGVSSTQPMNDKKLGEVGHRRLVCLKDGNTAVEEHVFVEDNLTPQTKRYFAYTVRHYTLKIAENIAYAKGEWWFTSEGNNTYVRWRYSFKLNTQKILGRMGALGRRLFQILFLKTRYNGFMVATLKKLKTDLEKKSQ